MINNDQKMVGAWLTAFFVLLASVTAQAADADTPVAVDVISTEELEKQSTSSVTDLVALMPELVTTARRDEESVLTVPLSISTISADEIQAAQILNLGDVAALTPGLSFQNYFGQSLSVPTIRGVSQVDIFGDPNAPVYIDGIYVSSSSGINFGFLDVERIEVLRGPQPAYFGYNAFSGAVNFVTARSSDEFEVNGEITVGSDEKQRITASVSGPLFGDMFSGRLSAMYDDFGGTYDNQNGNQDIGGAEYKVLSGQLFFTPGDNFSAQWNLYLSDDSIDPPAMNEVPANCEPELDPPTDPNSANPDRLLNYCGNLPSVGKKSLATTVGETGETREVFRTSLNMDWDVGFGTFSSLTGYSETKGEILASTDRGVDGTVFAYQTNVDGPFPGSFLIDTFRAPAIQGSAGKSELDDFSQEFRFSSRKDRSFRYTLGGYYRTTESISPIIEGFGAWAGADSLPADINLLFGVIPDLCPCIEFIPGVGVSAGFGGFIFSDIFSATEPGLDYINKSETDLKSGFFGLEYDIQSNITAYFEGRYTDFEETFRDGNPSTLPADAVKKFDDDFFNWRTSLEYHPDDLTTLYGSIATGIKQGGLDSFTPETIDPDPDCPGPDCVDDITRTVEFGQEKITTYELGYKTAMNDTRLFIDGSVFWSDWEEIVLPQIITSVDGKDILPTGVDGNIGDGSIFGFELSLQNQFTEAFSGGMGVSYNKGDFDKGQIESFSAFPSFAPNGDMAGQTLSRQPETQFNLNATYRAQLRGDWDWYTRADANYQSRWYVGLPNQARVPSHARANFRIGLESDRYTVELWVNNAFDDDTVDSAFRDTYLNNALPDGTQNFSTLFPWRMTVSHPERRAYGLTLRGRF